MKIKKLDELQKLNMVENEKTDVEFCWFTCGVSCTHTEAGDKVADLEQSAE